MSDELLTEVVDRLADAIASRLAESLATALTPSSSEPWRLLNVAEVATVLGRSRRWVHGAMKERGLPFVRLDGGALSFDPSAVKRWALERSVPAVEVELLASRLHAPAKPAAHAESLAPRLTAMQRVER